jgi:hypothetical protein
MNIDTAVSFLVKCLPSGVEPDAPAIAAKLGKPLQAVCNTLDRLATTKAEADATAKESARAREAQHAKNKRAVAKARATQALGAAPKVTIRCPRRAPTDAALLAEALKHQPGAPLNTADLAHAIGRDRKTVWAAINRLAAAGLWKWTVAENRGAAKVRKAYPSRPADTRGVTKPFGLPAAPKRGTIDLGSIVAIHGVGCLNRVDPRKKSANT